MSLLEIAVLISGPVSVSVLWAVGHYTVRSSEAADTTAPRSR